jgi:hypothetical protein
MKIFVVDNEENTAQWKTWHKKLFEDNGYDYYWIGYDDVVDVTDTEFLSFIHSNHYKSRQIQEISDLLGEEVMKEGDLIYFLDAWHPGIISTRQMLIGYKYNVRLAGFWHTGSYDEHDMLGAHMGRLLNVERGIHDCLDYNLFGTYFNLNLFYDNVLKPNDNGSKLIVIGFLYNTDHLLNAPKEKIIIFPHRLAPEKGVEVFDQFKSFCHSRGQFKDYQFIKTMEVTKDKDEYHELLSKAQFAISFAKQETFGISMIESTLSGCIPIVPDYLSYSEIYPKEFKYSHWGAWENIFQNILIKMHTAVRIGTQPNINDPAIINGSRLLNFLSELNDLK